MQPDDKDQPKATRWGLPASVATHLAVVALLVFGLPRFDFSPPKEQSVDVQLVPPPEPAKPPPPASKPAPAAAPKPAPAPPPEPKMAETPPPSEKPAAPQPAVMQPVVEFGDKDSGPRKSADGGDTEDAGERPATGPAADKPETPPAEEPAKADAGGARIAIVKPPEAQAPKPAKDRADKASTPKLARAKTLFSRAMTDDPVARTAIGKIPRDLRGGTLCGTELREQLVRGSPSHAPDLLPSLRLKKGDVIDVKAAFHAQGVWRAVALRCQVDPDAMKVLSFAFRVGDPIPRSDWKRLGLPSQ